MALKCTSANDVTSHIRALVPALSVVETEDSWDRIAKAMAQLMTLCANGAYDYPESLISALRPVLEPINSAMTSERTRLSGVAIDLVKEIATGIGASFDTLLNTFFPTLLALCARTSKVVITRARACIFAIIESSQLPAVFPHLVQSIKDKSASLRIIAAEATLVCLNCFNPPDLEKETRIKDIETLIKLTSRDANADVRKAGKKIFEAYKVLLPSRVESFTAPLTPTIKKYLNVSTTKKVQPMAHMRTNESKKILSSSTSALPVQASTTSSFASSSRSKSSPLAKSTSSSNVAPAKDALRPISVHRSSQSSKAMPPPATIPIRPALPSKLSSSSSNRDTNDSNAPTRVTRPPPSNSNSTSSSTMPHRPPAPPMRAPRPETAVNTVERGKTIQAQRVPIAFPSQSDNEEDRALKSTSDAVRPPPGSRTRSLFGRHKPELPKLVKQPEPKPKIAAPSFKPLRQPTRSAAASSKIAATKAATTVAKSSATTKAPAKAPVKSSQAPFVPKRTDAVASTKAASRVTAAKGDSGPGTMSKPAWGGRQAKPESRGKMDTKVTPQSRPTSRITAPSGSSPTPEVPAINCPASESLEAIPTPSINPVLAPIDAEGPLSDSSGDEMPGDVQAAPTSAESTPATVEAEVACTLEIDTDTPLTEGDDHEVDNSLGSTEAEALQINIAGASPLPARQAPSTPLTVRNERFLWETKQLEKTPISSLLSSIEQGFLFTPSSPLSPPAGYLQVGRDSTNLSMPFPLDLNRRIGPDMHLKCENSNGFMFGGENVAR